MGNLTSPLADIIRRAAESKPLPRTEKITKRFRNASAEVVCLLDYSGSMTDLVGHSGMSKHQHLVIALADVLQSNPKVRLIAFGTNVRNGKEVWEAKDPSGLGSPAGGTPLHKALQFARQYRPRKTIIISDGLPDCERSAEQEADQLTGAIDTIYCGPDGHPALQFLRKLAKDSGGTSVHWDGYRSLADGIRALLPAPE